MKLTTNSQELFPEPNPFNMNTRRSTNRKRFVAKDDPPTHFAPNIFVILALIGALIIVAVVTCSSAFSALNNPNASATSTVGSEANTINTNANSGTMQDAAKSTPKSEWRRGVMPYLYQIDSEWADQPYAGGTIKTHGCGPTCLSMVYVALTGMKNYDPKAMADFSEKSGFIQDGLTAWALMSEGAQKLGLKVQEVPYDVEALKQAARNHPLILSMGAGDFTTKGHFIVVSEINEQGQLVVHDPNSVERSQTTWDPERVLSQCRMIWAFSA